MSRTPGPRVPPPAYPSDTMRVDSPSDRAVDESANEMSGLSLSPYNTSSMVDYNAQRSDKGGGSDTSSVAWDRLQDVKTYFTNTGLKFRKPIAVGNHGGTVLFDKFDVDENGGGEVLAKSLVVKYALDTEDDASTHNDEDLENEMGWLRKMHYAEHIIQTEPEYWNLWDDDKSKVGDGAGAGHLLKKPVIVMEYLEHGTLDQLVERFTEAGVRVPDRMVWFFALCLVRACIAMGYRDQFVGVDKTTKEQVPRPVGGGELAPPSGLAQDSMKGANVLIGGLVPGDVEHQITPLLKLIDFGRGVEYKADNPNNPQDGFGENTGLAHNLDGVGYILSDLVQLGAAEYDAGTSEWTTETNDVLYGMDFETDADRQVLEDGRVSRPLRDLIAYFRTRSPDALPDLNEARRMCVAGINRSAKSADPVDSNASVRFLVQRLVFNADMEEGDFEAEYNEVLERERERKRRIQEDIDRGDRV